MKGVLEANCVYYFVDFDKPVLFINETHLFNGVLKVHENTAVRIQCFVDGNPIPSIHLRNRIGYLRTNKQNSKWANYTLVSAQCNDTDTYSCTGKFTVFNVSEQTAKLDVMCKYSKIHLNLPDVNPGLTKKNIFFV